MACLFGRIPAGALVVSCALIAAPGAQTPSPQTPPATAPSAEKPSTQKPMVKGVRAVPIVSVQGKDNYDAYCAVCHGPDARGTGPAAPAMKVQVPDLTAIAKRNKGKFDPLAVEQIIRGTGKTSTPAHGVETMPIWGEVFRNEDRATSALRIGNLVKYLQSIQVN